MTNQKFSTICLIYFISLFCFVVVRIASSLGAFSFMPSDIADLIFTIIIQLMVMGIIPFVLYITVYKKEKITKQSIKTALSDIGFKKISLKSIICSVLLGICVYVFNIIIASFFDLILSLLGYAGTGGSGSTNSKEWYLFFSLFITAVMPGIFEEILHRGILLKGVKENTNIKCAIILSGVLFGLMHLNINQFFYAAIIGMFFTIMAILTKSIWVPIILHFMNNAINVYLSWANASGSFGSDFYEILNNFLQNNNIVFVMICAVSIILVLTILAVYLVIALYNENNKENKIYLRLLTPNHMKNYLKAKKNDILNQENQNQTINYSKCVSRENDVIPAEQSLPDLFNINNTKSEKISFKYSIFLYATLILGGLTTLFTYIWGIL